MAVHRHRRIFRHVDFGLYVLLCKAVGPQVDLAKATSFIVDTITA